MRLLAGIVSYCGLCVFVGYVIHDITPQESWLHASVFSAAGYAALGAIIVFGWKAIDGNWPWLG